MYVCSCRNSSLSSPGKLQKISVPLIPQQQDIEYFFREGSSKETPQKTIKNSTKKTRRGRGESEKVKNDKNTNLTIIGNNTAGLTGKMDSLKRVIEVFTPGVVMLQETK